MTTPQQRHIVDVSDVERLLECAQTDRQRAFQSLVRRFISQILYGCTSTFCTTPTCLSCNKRLVHKPFRPPTQLTARALAFYLASQDDPSRRLCPHVLNVDPDTLEIEGLDGEDVYREDGEDASYSHLPHRLCPSAVTGSQLGVRRATRDPADARRITNAIEHRHQSRKDPKSLGQNLYDSLTIIFAFSKHIPTPPAVLSSLSSQSTQEHRSVRSPPLPLSNPLPIDEQPTGSNQEPFTEHASPVTPSHAVNDGHVSESTPQSTRRPSRTSTANITSEVRRDGQRVHKIRHVPNDHGHDLLSQKLSNGLPLRRAYDGAMDGVMADKFRMGATSIASKKKPTPILPPLAQPVDRSDDATFKAPDEQPSVPIYSHLTTEILDELKEQVFDHRADQLRQSSPLVDFDPNRRYRPAKQFVNRSLYYTLGDAETLLKSFHDQYSPDYMYSPLPHLDAHRLSHAFRDWGQRNGSLIFDSLYESLDALFRPPPELTTQKSPCLKPSRKAAAASPRIASSIAASGRHLSDLEAAHIVMICIHALTSSVHPGWPHTWVQVRKLRGWGVVIPGAIPNSASTDNFAHPWLEIIDELEYEPAIRLATRLLQAIGTRRCHEHMLATVNAQDDGLGQAKSYVGVERLLPILIGHLTQVEKAALERKGKTKSSQNTDEDPGWTVTATFMEFLHTIIVKQWDGNVEVNKWGSVGTAVTLLSHLYANMRSLNLRLGMFQVPYISEEIDSVQTPLDFLKHKERPNSFHVLQYPILFAQDTLVGYFRAINFNRMFKQFRKTAHITNFQSRWDHLVNNPRHWNIAEDQLGVVLAEYLVLDVSRHSPLEETLDQLWGQEKRKLMKPLKVRIGILDGEVGLDQGGVTYEFFRLILNEAFTPDNGMFTVDEKTGMTWFQPASLEPLWKFEMIGVLFSLAVYNGITLPVTFPLALYDYFLHQEHNSEGMDAIEFITDGWPDLAKSFHEFLTYQGDVADIFMRDYTFSFTTFGQNIDVDMQAFRDTEWPDSSFNTSDQVPTVPNMTAPSLDHPAWRRTRDVQTEPQTVTNEDREQYIEDYVEWLTYRSVAPQLQAFARGFHTCLHRASLNFFAPRTLRSLVEGSSQSISPSLLRTQSTQYELPYSDTHPTIKNFWNVVEQYDQDELRRLLEFVTASERVPITGYESIKFEIVWARGDTERLPTSSTCFGKLWLPEYASREKLREKLGRAIKNSEGFGIV